MPEFTELQHNALMLADRVNDSRHRSCTFFFQGLIEDCTTVDKMVKMIVQLANLLKPEHDCSIAEFLQQGPRRSTLITLDDVMAFKTKVLLGGYLFAWRKVETKAYSLRLGGLVACFKQDLGVDSRDLMGEGLTASSFDCLSRYCSFAYKKRELEAFGILLEMLGPDIQAELVIALNPELQITELSFLNIGKGLLQNMGFN